MLEAYEPCNSLIHFTLLHMVSYLHTITNLVSSYRHGLAPSGHKPIHSEFLPVPPVELPNLWEALWRSFVICVGGLEQTRTPYLHGCPSSRAKVSNLLSKRISTVEIRQDSGAGQCCFGRREAELQRVTWADPMVRCEIGFATVSK